MGDVRRRLNESLKSLAMQSEFTLDDLQMYRQDLLTASLLSPHPSSSSPTCRSPPAAPISRLFESVPSLLTRFLSEGANQATRQTMLSLLPSAVCFTSDLSQIPIRQIASHLPAEAVTTAFRRCLHFLFLFLHKYQILSIWHYLVLLPPKASSDSPPSPPPRVRSPSSLPASPTSSPPSLTSSLSTFDIAAAAIPSTDAIPSPTTFLCFLRDVYPHVLSCRRALWERLQATAVQLLAAVHLPLVEDELFLIVRLCCLFVGVAGNFLDHGLPELDRQGREGGDGGEGTSPPAAEARQDSTSPGQDEYRATRTSPFCINEAPQDLASSSPDVHHLFGSSALLHTLKLRVWERFQSLHLDALRSLRDVLAVDEWQRLPLSRDYTLLVLRPLHVEVDEWWNWVTAGWGDGRMLVGWKNTDWGQSGEDVDVYVVGLLKKKGSPFEGDEGWKEMPTLLEDDTAPPLSDADNPMASQPPSPIHRRRCNKCPVVSLSSRAVCSSLVRYWRVVQVLPCICFEILVSMFQLIDLYLYTVAGLMASPDEFDRLMIGTPGVDDHLGFLRKTLLITRDSLMTRVSEAAESGLISASEPAVWLHPTSFNKVHSPASLWGVAERVTGVESTWAVLKALHGQLVVESGRKAVDNGGRSDEGGQSPAASEKEQEKRREAEQPVEGVRGVDAQKADEDERPSEPNSSKSSRSSIFLQPWLVEVLSRSQRDFVVAYLQEKQQTSWELREFIYSNCAADLANAKAFISQLTQFPWQYQSDSQPVQPTKTKPPAQPTPHLQSSPSTPRQLTSSNTCPPSAATVRSTLDQFCRHLRHIGRGISCAGGGCVPDRILYLLWRHIERHCKYLLHQLVAKIKATAAPVHPPPPPPPPVSSGSRSSLRRKASENLPEVPQVVGASEDSRGPLEGYFFHGVGPKGETEMVWLAYVVNEYDQVVKTAAQFADEIRGAQHVAKSRKDTGA
eukprot:GHVS01030870.1.p1 GENE.GHVS01030870.1~~GHVS01030870.1.p1  ORF type:complete len:960 (-),score=182.88 GHVS01030870.1:101-2980(-)